MNSGTDKKPDRALATRCRECFGAVVLGLNDALIEFTGALAGFTIALQNNRLIVLAGLTAGVSATLSMAAAEYLAQKSLARTGTAWRASFATGFAYLITVALLLFPFIIMKSPLHALAVCLFLAAVIIISFSWTVSRMRKTNFVHDCLQMLAINICVAALAFLVSWSARELWGIDV